MSVGVRGAGVGGVNKDVPGAEVGRIDATAELGRLGLNDHLSAERSSGVRAMVERSRAVAAAA